MIPQTPDIMKSPLCYEGDKRNIPADTPLGTNQLSYKQGFPPITSIDVDAGGIAPERQDMNAALNLLSTFIYYMQSGNQFVWDALLDYNKGATVLGSDGALYFCIQANGATSPNTVQNPTTSTGYWVKVIDAQGVFNINIIADGAVSSAKLANGSVTSAKIADGTIVDADIANTTITGAKLVNKTITATQIADNTITAAQLAANSVGASELADNAVDTAAIAKGAVTNDKIAGILPVAKGGTGVNDGFGWKNTIPDYEFNTKLGLTYPFTTQELVTAIVNTFGNTPFFCVVYDWHSGTSKITDFPGTPYSTRTIINFRGTNQFYMETTQSFDLTTYICNVSGGIAGPWIQTRNADGSIPTNLLSNVAPLPVEYTNSSVVGAFILKVLFGNTTRLPAGGTWQWWMLGFGPAGTFEGRSGISSGYSQISSTVSTTANCIVYYYRIQ